MLTQQSRALKCFHKISNIFFYVLLNERLTVNKKENFYGDNIYPKEHCLIGQILMENNIITPQQLDLIINKQKETGEIFGKVLLGLGILRDEIIFFPYLADQMGIDFVELKKITISDEAIERIQAKIAIHYEIMPVRIHGEYLVMATNRPMDLMMLDEISVIINYKIKIVLSSKQDILDAIAKYYGTGAATIDQMMDESGSLNQEKEEISIINDIESEASIGNFLNQVFQEAHKKRATDIHIEPFYNELHIRYRIDGFLYDAQVPSNIKYFKDSINSRIKILSNLNIAEKRMPQDGRFKIKVEMQEIDFRVSFLPTAFGESVVLRVLSSCSLYSLSDLGLPKTEQEILGGLIKKPHGIIFLTGPTGSGKTTTLYSCLSKINTAEKKILTIEDPIEYQLKGITQIQTNSKIGLTFATGLRSMLRHDPDVMMVGEVRDVETAEIAISVALTGHLVFSTLHTNDASSGVARLLDMGLDPYLIASTVECFIAQRLVRKLCLSCREPIKEVDPKFCNDEEIIFKGDIFESSKSGCDVCNFTGYRGREGIYEFLIVDDAIRKLIMERATANEITQAAKSNGMKTLLLAGLEKVGEGIVSPSEALRVVGHGKCK